MKQKKSKIFIYIFLSIFICFLIVIFFLIQNKFKLNILSREIQDHNIKFNEFDRNLKGTEVLTLINYTVDYNNKMKEKNSNDIVRIDIQIGEEKVISMNSILDSGIDNFTLYLGDQNFKLIDREYHRNGKISVLKYKLLSLDSINNLDEKLSI